MIKFSRHAKRRMSLYNLTEADILKIINEGEKEIISENKISFIATLDKYNYPVKAVCKVIGSDKIVITNYPLKKRL